MLFSRLLSVAGLVVAIFSWNTSTSAQEAIEGATSTAPDSSTVSESKAKKLAGRSIQEVMTPDEFKAAGLDKLSEDELQHLDAWLQGYRQTTEKRASEQAEQRANEEIKKATEEVKAKQPKLMVDRVTSRVDGSFLGLTGHTIIHLEDGTTWKQANIDDRYRCPVTDHPLVLVSHSPFGYKMRMEGTPEFYVNPVREKQ